MLREIVAVTCCFFVLAPAVAGDDAPNSSEPIADGYCIVSLLSSREWKRGSEEFTSVFDGETYHFASPEARIEFDANPPGFVPALGGNCVVSWMEDRKRVPGRVQFASLFDGRLFLFAGDAERKRFRENRANYGQCDLALNGDCVVTFARDEQRVRGQTEHVSVYHGTRFHFTSADARIAFLADPVRYVRAVQDHSKEKKSSGERAAGSVRISGMTVCAQCDYGVRPIRHPHKLGMAVRSGGRIYVIEEAHVKYPRIYARRFDGDRVMVRGRIIRESGRFAWIEPASIKML